MHPIRTRIRPSPALFPTRLRFSRSPTKDLPVTLPEQFSLTTPLKMHPTIKSKNVAKSFLNFLNKSVTPFHAVQSCVEILQEAGFKEVREKESFKVKPGDKLFIKK
ncbi:aminopeptidase I zinc metalloprotease (M18) domain-containing protein [Ditylenchus destructor]|nr:aminopeptidase I zinc metalloprotease (M18) domain-containing protein [Ditylenchus destructor]